MTVRCYLNRKMLKCLQKSKSKKVGQGENQNQDGFICQWFAWWPRSIVLFSEEEEGQEATNLGWEDGSEKDL